MTTRTSNMQSYQPRGVLVKASTPTNPVTTAEFKTHAREDLNDSSNNTLIDSYITAATDWCETFTGRAFVTTTYAYTMESFPCGESPIVIPRCPLVTVTSISYVNDAGTTTLWSSSLYQIQTSTGKIAPNYNQSYPTTQPVLDAVQILFTAGYGTASSVPEGLKLAIKLLATHWYEHRSAVSELDFRQTLEELPLGIKNLLWPYRMMYFA